MARDNTPEQTARQNAEIQLDQLTGAFIRAWTQAEWEMFRLMAALLDCEYGRAEMIWSLEVSFRAKRELLQELGSALLADRYVEYFNVLMAQVKHLSEKRNLLAHERVSYVGRGRLLINDDPKRPLQLSNLRQWLKEVRKLEKDVETFSLQVSLSPDGRLAQPRERPASMQV